MAALPTITVDTPAPEEAPRITGVLSKGEAPPPSPPKELAPMPVVDAVEYSIPSEGRSITMERVEVEPTPPIEPSSTQTTDSPDPEAVAAMVEAWKAEHPGEERHFLALSVTVYDHKASHVRWTHEGERFSIWSNVDFNVMCGFGGIESADGKIRYSLYIAAGNQTTGEVDEPGEVRANSPPDIPPLPLGKPGFVIEKGDAGNAQALAGIIALHELYAVHGSELKEAYELRTRRQAARAAYLRENPPKLPDVKVRFGPKINGGMRAEGGGQ